MIVITGTFLLKRKCSKCNCKTLKHVDVQGKIFCKNCPLSEFIGCQCRQSYSTLKTLDMFFKAFCVDCLLMHRMWWNWRNYCTWRYYSNATPLYNNHYLKITSIGKKYLSLCTERSVKISVCEFLKKKNQFSWVSAAWRSFIFYQRIWKLERGCNKANFTWILL